MSPDKSNNKAVFSRNLQRYMDICQKSRRDISDLLGVSYYTVSAWVNGEKYPRMDKITKLADYFGVRISDLVEESDVLARPVVTFDAPQFEMVADEEFTKLYASFKKLSPAKRKLISELIKNLSKEN